MTKHKVINKIYTYRQFDDCTLYEIYCSCGKKCGGWTPKDAEQEFNKHIKQVVK